MLPGAPTDCGSDEQSLRFCALRLVVCSQTLGGHLRYICMVMLAQSTLSQSAKAPWCFIPCFTSLCALVWSEATAATLHATQVAQQRAALAHGCVWLPWQDGCTWFCRFGPGEAGLASAYQTSQAGKTTQARCPPHHPDQWTRNGGCCSDGHRLQCKRQESSFVPRKRSTPPPLAEEASPL